MYLRLHRSWLIHLAVVSDSLARNIPTPAGWWPQECVHEVPSGTHISHDAHGVHYQYPNGSKDFRANCSSAPRPSLPHRRKSGGSLHAKQTTITTESHGYPVILWGNTNNDLKTFTATYNVPEAPAVFSGQVIYWWLGIEPDSASDVLQPVLGYNAFGSPTWSYASWNCCPAGHQHHATPINVSTGDILYGSLQSTGGDGYTVLSEYNKETSILQSDDQVPQVMPLLSMEVYYANCSSLPTGCMRMSRISVDPTTSFGSNEPQGFGLESACGWSLSLTDDTLSVCPPGMGNRSASLALV